MFYFPAVLLRVGACFADGALKPLEAGVFDIMECITFQSLNGIYIASQGDSLGQKGTLISLFANVQP